MKYEAEVEVLKRKLGDLEAIRMQLGLSQRKICQLLLVDPSAWTRWTKRGEAPPPHIFRALQWYLAIEEKYPALDVNFWLSNLSRPVAVETDARMLRETEQRLESFATKLYTLDHEWEERLQNHQGQSEKRISELRASIVSLKKKMRWAAVVAGGLGFVFGLIAAVAFVARLKT